jgi:hypothetical protein
MVKAFMQTAVVLLLGAALAGCTNTEVKMRHENPLDRIFDSGNFRLVLTGEEKASGNTSLTWSNVFHSTEGELSDDKLKINGSAQVFRSAASPGAADITAVKNASALSGSFTAVGTCSVAASGNSYAGNCEAVNPANKGAFIVQFNYRFTDKSDVITTGTIYSNFVVIQ